MESSPAQPADARRHRWFDLFLPRSGPLRTCVVLLLLGLLVVVFYAEENWRGRRAWENCQRELEARGEVLDWNAYLPAPVPDDQNIFKAPLMANWFVRTPDEPNTPMFNTGSLALFAQQRRSNPLAEVTCIASNDPAAIAQAGLLLRYEGHCLSLATPEDFAQPPPEIIPFIQFEEVTLSTAITALARQGNLNFIFDPDVLAGWRDRRVGSAEPVLSVSWENLSARQGLFLLLDNYSLTWVPEPRANLARIVARRGARGSVVVQEAARRRLKELFAATIRRLPTNQPGVSLHNVRNHRFIVGDPPSLPPERLLVLTSDLPTATELKYMLPTGLGPAFPGAGRGWHVETSGSNQFRVCFGEQPVFAAADLLAWTEQFERDLALLRTALKRPAARIDGDEQRPFNRPMPNFVNLRNVAQTLAERAQCHLLLGEPAPALEDLTLIHELRRCVGVRPATLVSAMIEVAITGLYAEIIADGLRLQAWREPELAALQKELAEINLLAVVSAALRTERAAACHTFLHAATDDVVESVGELGELGGSWRSLLQPTVLLLKVAPRGWVYQNLVTIAQADFVYQPRGFDAAAQLVSPGQLPPSGHHDRLLAGPAPFRILARIAVPNAVRALTTTARNQTKVNQALIACGLARHRLARGDYPESLAALAPEFAPKLPHDLIGGAPLKYRRAEDGQFLLYSIGWDEADDGGKFSRGKDGEPDYDSPDWVWH